MSASGLIYAAIAIMWAAVLIPMWLRSHDNATESRSAERFGQAMRVLSRREREVEVSASTQRIQREHDRPVMRRREARPPSLARRRARTLATLFALTLLTLTLGLVALLPLWAFTPFALLMVAFVVHLRIQARQREQRRRLRMQPRVPVGVTVADAAQDDERRSARQAHSPQGDQTPAREFVPGPSRAVVVEKKGAGGPPSLSFEDAAPAMRTGAADHEPEESWDPNPLPLPTYVTAPKATRPIKVIDLTTPGVWSAGRLMDELEDDVADEDLLAAQVAGEELDALIDYEAAPTAKPDGESGNPRAVGD